MKSCSILVADDHALMRRGLRQLLESEPGWKVIAEASSGRQAVNQALEYRPDLVVMDVSMPDLNGLEATRLILKELPETHVLILTMHDAPELIEKTLEAGASGYVLKSDAEADLVKAADALLHGRTFFTSAASRVVLERVRRPQQKPGSPLTLREIEIIRLLAQGKSNKEVAASLALSQRTVESHRTRIMQKLELDSFSELIRYAIRHNIIQP